MDVAKQASNSLQASSQLMHEERRASVPVGSNVPEHCQTRREVVPFLVEATMKAFPDPTKKRLCDPPVASACVFDASYNPTACGIRC